MNFLNTPPGQLLSAPASQSGTAGRIPGRASGPRRQRLPDHDGDRPVVVIRLGVRDERVRDVAANQLTARGGEGLGSCNAIWQKLLRGGQGFLATGAAIPGASVARDRSLFPDRSRGEARNGFREVGPPGQLRRALLRHFQHLRNLVHAHQIGKVRLIKRTVKIMYRLDFDPNYAG